MPKSFAEATAVEATDAHGRYSAVVHEGWDIGGNANGGYLMAIAGRAMAAAAQRPPLTITCHYLRPVTAGPCEIQTTVVRSGRRLATVTATLSVDGVASMQLLGSFGEQHPGGPSLHANEPIDLPAFEDCSHEREGPLPGLVQQIDVRLHPDDGGFRGGTPSGNAQMRGWFAFFDDEPVDVIGLLLAADAFAPPVFNSGLATGWVPSVELTVHVRGTPVAGPLRCSFRSRHVHDGLLDEDGEIWDSTGALVCQSRQLALMPR